MATDEFSSHVVAKKYKLLKKIGKGSFGEIYEAENLLSGEMVAVKLEKATATHPQLIHEAKVLKYLEGGFGIPKVRCCGNEIHCNVMVMELLGPSVEHLFNQCGRRFSLKTILLLADQLLSAVEFIHSKGIIHRDIKPENILLGTGNEKNQLFLIDFGLAKRYRDPQTREHIPYAEKKNLTGTARYASLNAHKGIEQSRRDDLEGIGHTLMYLSRGGMLPWQGIKAKDKKQKYEKIKEKKLSTSLETLCKGHATEFFIFLNYVRRLAFDEAPDYAYLREIFNELFYVLNFKYDYQYDWSLLKPEGPKQADSQLADLQTRRRPQISPPLPPEIVRGQGKLNMNFDPSAKDAIDHHLHGFPGYNYSKAGKIGPHEISAHPTSSKKPGTVRTNLTSQNTPNSKKKNTWSNLNPWKMGGN